MQLGELSNPDDIARVVRKSNNSISTISKDFGLESIAYIPLSRTHGRRKTSSRSFMIPPISVTISARWNCRR